MTIRVWAPLPDRVRAAVQDTLIDLTRTESGWWVADLDLPTGTEYGFVLDEDPTVLPDPRGRRLPHGVHGPSAVFDPDEYPWQDGGWTGRELAGGIVYELHPGTFTPGGTLDSAAEKLDHLVDLGITHVELLPVNGFNGDHNWGYDGVAWYTVHEAYGGPPAYQRFVDACHRRGLAVIQDVVYNHLGPSGNYLPRFGPYLQSGRNTWGDNVNLDGPDSDEVRRYIIDNALMWLTDYHVDGLRLDAVHALVDQRAVHLLEELAAEVDALRTRLRRPLTLIAESDLNDTRLITPRPAGGYGLRAAWNDDLHHALHANVTGETSGYYADFAGPSALAKVLTHGYFHDGSYSSFRRRHHGRPVDTRSVGADTFVVALQTHDQIGNRAAGDRIGAQAGPRRQLLGATVLLCSPFTPMLFMGEEWAAGTPWQFFTSHPEPDLGRQTAEGRLAEFARMGWDPALVPDPQDPATFARSVLDWSEPARSPHREVLAAYRTLIGLRRSHPELTDPGLTRVEAGADDAAGILWLRRGDLLMVANFADSPAWLRCGQEPQVLFCSAEPPATDPDGITVPPAAAVLLRVLATPTPAGESQHTATA